MRSTNISLNTSPSGQYAALKYALFLWMLSPSCVLAGVETDIAEALIDSKRNTWFKELQNNVLTGYPQPGSESSELDRIGSIAYVQDSGARYKLARSDRSQETAYQLSIMTQSALGSLTPAKTPTMPLVLSDLSSYDSLVDLYELAARSYDPNKQRKRTADFILKEQFLRGRPYEVLENSQYIKDYLSIKGSSFPSGHTWEGYTTALPMSLVFPERGSEIISRALQYGESRVVLEAHFPTDTIASRIGNYYYLSKILSDDTLATTFFELSKDVRTQVEESKLCSGPLRGCLEAQDSPLTDTQANENYSIGYYNQLLKRPVVALTPEHIPQQSSALLRFRFPYLKSPEWQQILASTAYPSNSLAGWTFDANNPDANWGLINLPRAFSGPTYFYEDFTVNQNPASDMDLAGFSQTDTWKEDIGGPGSLIKNGSGTLILTGNNTFSGGIDLNQGTLQVGNGGTQGAVTGNINNDATLVFNRSDDTAFGGDISGDGKLVKDGAGLLILTGNTVSNGGIDVNQGAVQVGNGGTQGSVTGNINNNGTLTFNRSDNIAFGSNISGGGSLIKDGSGMLELNGNNSSTGHTYINKGALKINGTLNHALVYVESGGQLQGIGEVGSVTVNKGGIIAPGNSIGTLRITQNLTFRPESIYQVEVDATGRADKLDVAGHIDLQGGLVDVQAEAGDYKSNTSLPIIQAQKGVSGQFASVTSNLAFLTPSLTYETNQVNLNLVRNDVSPQALVETANEKVLATQLLNEAPITIPPSTLPVVITPSPTVTPVPVPSATLLAATPSVGAPETVPLTWAEKETNTLIGLSRDEFKHVMQSMTGELHASLKNALLQDSGYVRNATLNRLYQTEQNPRALGAWGYAFNSSGAQNRQDDAAKLNRSTHGVIWGLDQQDEDSGLRAGIAASYQSSSASLSMQSASADVETYSLAAYAGKQLDSVTVRLGAAYAWHEIDSKRDIGHKNGTTRLKGSYDGSTRQVFAELSKAINFNTLTLEPFVGLNYTHLETEAFTEKQNLFALSGKKSRMDVTSARLGARVNATHPLARGMTLRLSGSTGLQHTFSEPSTETRLKLRSQGDFVSISGLPVQKDMAQLALNASLDLTPSFSIGLGYTGEIGQRFHDQSASATASWTF